MVATGFEGVAPLRGEHSFTMFLVNVLKSRREEDKATFADALCRMVAAKLNRTDMKSALETSRSTPRHIPFANKGEKIIIGEIQEFDDSEPAQESQSEVGEAGGDRDWLDDLYPTAPDYSAFEERLVLSKDVPCPEQYSHIRTGEIRTLHILSSKDVNEPIIARLQNEDFLPHSEGSHYGNYTALSWTWGRAAWTSNIYIVDENLHARHAIAVPPTLESALRHVRHPTKKVVLWVDLICIRQDAAEERAFMISILPDIFKHASSVIVWLGDEDESSRSVVDFVGKVRDLENFDALVKNDETPQQWDFLVAFLRRPWFSRRWVFQEIILAREAIICCGSQRIGWTDFSDVVVLLGTCFDEVQYRLKRKEITNK
ncbi:hypothetical protein SLS63_008499 [Diaporthe eres]|uniref:Heterokaryon incompatibility domain-containing protein n=1 Tax=Diaporthe eres TaxID=83184 RepID=A0ABR1P2H6_DIAER